MLDGALAGAALSGMQTEQVITAGPYGDASSGVDVSQSVAVSAPTDLVVTMETDLIESNIAHLELEFQNADASQLHTVSIDWGDGHSGTFNLAAGETSFATTHRYVDDDPTGTSADDYLVSVEVVDANLASISTTTAVHVRNAPPSAVIVSATPEINENGLVKLQVSFQDPGAVDRHTIDVDWGDGQSQTYQLAQGGRFLVANHQYLDDDPSGGASDVYTIRVAVRDDDLGEATRERIVVVNNVAPTNLQGGLVATTIDEGDVAQLALTFDDPGSLDKHSYTIDWGDGHTTAGAVAGRSVEASHVFADNGDYEIVFRLSDDDGGAIQAVFALQVQNVAPDLTGVDQLTPIDEGAFFTLDALGVGIVDPGFDNAANQGNAANGGEFEERFTAYEIDWGDGSPVSTFQIVQRWSGAPGTPTSATIKHDPHVYADNGDYTVRLRMSDDDGAPVTRTFVIVVRNVAPTLTLTDTVYEIDEGQSVSLPDLGVFFDPGFNNLANTHDPSNGGETVETFTYEIDWGDGFVDQGQLPASVFSGGPGQPTIGTLIDEHFYADNDRDNTPDNRYTVVVKLSDDDDGLVERSFEIIVRNTDPVLSPLQATDLNTKGQTTLTLDVEDQGADELQILVDWGDRLDIADPEARFVVETVYVGATPATLTLHHTYTGPPDPLHPAASIVISVKVRDDDFGTGVTTLGESNTETVAIDNPGEGVNPVRIDTTPQVPRLTFPERTVVEPLPSVTAGPQESAAGGDVRGSGGESKAANERFLELRIVYPDGAEGPGVQLSFQSLNNLPALFRNLPDNHYRLYLVQPETNQQRLVIDVYVRNGRLVDPGDESEGALDRPPTEDDSQLPTEGGVSGTPSGSTTASPPIAPQ
ncbi:MAG: PKD domain-containing protein, partial [Planctomycetales bacterium]|nr:PKD domain-containing protein [Planctomycetales bacterium]